MSRGAPTAFQGTVGTFGDPAVSIFDQLMIELTNNGWFVWDDLDTRDKVLTSYGESTAFDITAYLRLTRVDNLTVDVIGYFDWDTVNHVGRYQNADPASHSIRYVAEDDVTDLVYWGVVSPYGIAMFVYQLGSIAQLIYAECPDRTHVKDAVAGITFLTDGAGLVQDQGPGASMVLNIDRDLTTMANSFGGPTCTSSGMLLSGSSNVWVFDLTPEGVEMLPDPNLELVTVEAITASTITLTLTKPHIGFYWTFIGRDPTSFCTYVGYMGGPTIEAYFTTHTDCSYSGMGLQTSRFIMRNNGFWSYDPTTESNAPQAGTREYIGYPLGFGTYSTPGGFRGVSNLLYGFPMGQNISFSNVLASQDVIQDAGSSMNSYKVGTFLRTEIDSGFYEKHAVAVGPGELT